MAAQKLKVAKLTLPAGGKKAWTRLMVGGVLLPESIEKGSPIVQAQAVFSDGTRVVGGVLKSDTPDECNWKFMWVFDANGRRYPDWPIDVGDHTDFEQDGYVFSLTEGVDEEYSLDVVEESARASAGRRAQPVAGEPEPQPAAEPKGKPKAKAAAKPKAKAGAKAK